MARYYVSPAPMPLGLVLRGADQPLHVYLNYTRPSPSAAFDLITLFVGYIYSLAMRTITLPSSIALLALTAANPASAEKVLGAYIFARHGDRTAKVLSNTRLTDLGYQEVYQAGSYYHDRYIESNSSLQIVGISEQVVNQKQITVSAPSDAVLQNSATGFLQGVYPPVGSSASETLRDGSTVEAPLNGYQLIPLSTASTGTGSEDASWLQSANECQKSQASSLGFYDSTLYKSLLSETKDFYQSLSPMLNRTFTESQINFENAYTIFDYLNVASIHNSSSDFPSSDLLTPDVYHQLLFLANIHEYNLAYNQSEPIRAVSGSVLAGEVLAVLNETITSQGKSAKLNVQFGAYATFLSYFGLAQLSSINDDFTGVPDYASSMSWELVTDSTSNDFPSPSEISVRFIFHNGTITNTSTPTAYPLFGQSSTLIPWADFVQKMQKIAVTSKAQWCYACGNTAGMCAANTLPGSVHSTSLNPGGISRAVAGVIGAMVTLAVILGLEALFFLLGGFRIAKRRTGGSVVSVMDVTENKMP